MKRQLEGGKRQHLKNGDVSSGRTCTGRRGEDGGGWDRARTSPPEQARSELIIATFFSASCRINYFFFSVSIICQPFWSSLNFNNSLNFMASRSNDRRLVKVVQSSTTRNQYLLSLPGSVQSDYVDILIEFKYD